MTTTLSQVNQLGPPRTARQKVYWSLTILWIKFENSFTTFNTIIEEIENEESDLTDSDGDDKEKSQFKFEEAYLFQEFHQIAVVLPNKSFMFNQTFEKFIEEVLFKQNHTKEIKIYLKKVILLDNCSTMDLFLNLYLF